LSSLVEMAHFLKHEVSISRGKDFMLEAIDVLKGVGITTHLCSLSFLIRLLGARI